MAPSEQPPPDALVIWGWVIKGFEGCLNLIERMRPYYAHMKVDRAKEFHRIIERFTRIANDFYMARAKPPVGDDERNRIFEPIDNEEINRTGWGG